MEFFHWKKWFSDHREVIFKDLFTFLQFKSIATDPQYDQETKACADWLKEYLQKIGLSVELWKTSQQPVVFAQTTPFKKDRPTLMIYQHYDVQPVDPLELWHSPPFEPTLRNNHIYCRGAQDNKGQCFYTLIAIQAFLEKVPSPEFNLKVFIEGEEETGSKGTKEIIEKKKKELQSDFLLFVDAGIPGAGIPAITLGIRGIVTLEVRIQVAKKDMHSGMMGGVAYNPIRALIHALAQCWDSSGKIAVPNFYKQVLPLSSEEKKQFDLFLDEKKTKEEFGLLVFGPEPGYSIQESATIRPTFEINGIFGGYTGEGFKTVLPAEAGAKISFRLVPNQNPEEIVKQFSTYFRSLLPNGISCEIKTTQGCTSFRANPNSLVAKRAAKAYEEVLGKPCKSILAGGSVPITSELVRVCGGDAILMGYGLESDDIHAPNEHFGIDRFEQGFLTMSSIFRQFHEEKF